MAFDLLVDGRNTPEAIKHREIYPYIYWDTQDKEDYEKGFFQQRYSLGKGYWAWCTLKRYHEHWSNARLVFRKYYYD